ncbi:trehalose-6-phosphate synthase [Aestuariibius sp. 2305UL40-4]|uniref:alpha,alpha-trehalose-phosphate synthase (UDP-forming) n=1 Tax=Aestuariibius violaceus TaxID=3234132 RepID=UPI00345EFE5A
MSGRLIVVSNRVPLGGPPQGGLVVALHECLEEIGGLWVGAAGDTAEAPSQTFTEHDEASYRKLTFELSQEDYANYYLGYANAVLWPLCHRRGDLIDLQPEYHAGYMAVNERLAGMLAEIVEPDDRIWIHDYHFFPLAHCLRARGVKASLGFFLHIPFPTRTDLDALPNRDDFLDWIAAFDLVGLQTQADVASCLEVYRAMGEGEMLLDGTLRHGKRRFAVQSFPIGIDAQGFAETAVRGNGREILNLRPAEKLLIGIDRLDYSKGLPNRMRAVGQYLDERSENDPRATFLQIAPPTREGVEAYDDIRAELERISGQENGKHSDLDWTPIRYIHQMVPRESLAPILRAANVGLVTPMADGMNLVAKEFVAAQDAGDPGVLILSRFAGAAEQLSEALIVNPFDMAEMADAIRRALAMPQTERRQRHEALASSVFSENIGHWTQTYLDAFRRAAPSVTPMPLSA